MGIWKKMILTENIFIFNDCSIGNSWDEIPVMQLLFSL